jgi:hypothetical protein
MGIMRRKTFDTLLTAGGLVLTIVLIVAGALLMWGYSFANSNVHSQLSEQQITFPTASVLAHPNGGEITASMQKYLGPYAGKQLTTGPEALAYADHFIAVHLSEMPYGGVYSKVSSASQAQPTNAALKAEVQTVFQGTTLRGLLLEAYAFSEFATISLVAGIASFILAAIMAILTGLGFWHVSRVAPTEEVLAGHLGIPTPTPAS